MTFPETIYLFGSGLALGAMWALMRTAKIVRDMTRELEKIRMCLKRGVVEWRDEWND